jgi:hypothetical protein
MKPKKKPVVVWKGGNVRVVVDDVVWVEVRRKPFAWRRYAAGLFELSDACNGMARKLASLQKGKSK